VTGADGRYTLRHLAPGHYVFIILINTHLDPVCPDDYEVDSTKTFGPTVPLAVALAQAVRLPDLEIYRCYPFNLTCPTDRQVLTTTRPTFRWTAPLRTQDIRYQVIIVETPFTQTARDEKGYEVRGQSWTYEPAPPQRPILKIGRNYRVFVWAMDTQGRRREMATASFSLAPKDRAAAAQADNLAVWPVLMPDPQENQKPAERIQALQEALTNHPHTTYRGLLHDFLGHLYWQTGDQNRARQEFAKVRQECPDWNIGRCAAAALADLQAGRPPRELDEYIERLAPKGKPEPSRSDRR
jgi:hypothetical protein